MQQQKTDAAEWNAANDATTKADAAEANAMPAVAANDATTKKQTREAKRSNAIAAAAAADATTKPMSRNKCSKRRGVQKQIQLNQTQ
jgi:hypothetical protein